MGDPGSRGQCSPYCNQTILWTIMLMCLSADLQWAGQLGDGRAISLGQAVGPDGTPYELQLKVGEHSFSSISLTSA